MTIQSFLTLPAMQDLGHALLHFLWQGTMLAAVYFLTASITQSARLRYAAGCVVMLAMPVVFLATILRIDRTPVHSFTIQASETKSFDLDFQPDPEGAITAASLPSRIPPLPSASNTLPGYIACLWLVGVVVLSIFTVAGWLRVQRLKRRDITPANSTWLASMEPLKRRLQISKPIRLCISGIAEVPTVIGWLRPCILLPVCALTGLDELQLRAILAHELAHIRRHDYVVNLLQNAIETLLFYHPAVWWVSRRIRQEREHCCDDLAVNACGDVMLYATALTQLEELRGNHPEPALAATGGDLLGRIHRLLRTRNAKGPGQIVGSVATAMTAALALMIWIGIGHAPTIHAQSPIPKAAQINPGTPRIPIETAQVSPVPIPKVTPAARPEFETASIRPAAPVTFVPSGSGRGGGAGDGSGNCGIQRLTEDESVVTYRCVNLRGLIQFAFGIGEKPGAMSGPAWLMDYSVQGQRFDIVATLPRGATKDQVPAMSQSLLESRFHLTVHRGPQEQPVEALVVDKGGLKLKAGSPDAVLHNPGPDARPCPPQSLSCSATITYRDGEQIASTPLAAGVRQFSSPRIGTAVETRVPGTPTTRIEAPDTTLGGLAELLYGMVPLPIVDMTGTNGRYDVTLEISVDMNALMNQAIAESPAAQAAQAGPITGPNPALDAAIQKAGADHVEATQKALQAALLKLGIRMEQRKAPIETLIVDRADKVPTAN